MFVDPMQHAGFFQRQPNGLEAVDVFRHEVHVPAVGGGEGNYREQNRKAQQRSASFGPELTKMTILAKVPFDPTQRERHHENDAGHRR